MSATKAQLQRQGLRLADSDLKKFFLAKIHFFKGAGALMEKLCEGPHVSADFQPARFVARLEHCVKY